MGICVSLIPCAGRRDSHFGPSTRRCPSHRRLWSAAGVTHFWSSWGGFGGRSESHTTVVER